jgi:hypothetical protein
VTAPTAARLDFATVWAAALPYDRFVDEATANRDLWLGVYRLARLPDWAAEWARARSAPLRLLAIAEDWCGDAVNTMPILARLAEATSQVDLRVLRRDEHPAVMDRYLTNGSRSIPIVIALDEGFVELGHWGPRPAALQAWVMANKDTLPKEDRYREVRRWYAKDRGESTLREVLGLVK